MSGGELAIVVVAIVIGTLVKSVTGMGLPLIAIPIATLFIDAADAIVVIAIPNVAANTVLLIGARRHLRETRDLPTLAVTGIAGAVLGTLLLVNVSETPLVVAVVVAIAVYVVLFFTHTDLRVQPAASRRWAPVVGATAGVFQGAVGISGPIVGSWIHSYRLSRGAHIASVTTLFMITGLTQVVILIASGELAGRGTAVALACIPVLGSIPLGTRLRRSVSPRGFDLAIVTMLIVSAITLVAKLVL